MFVLFKGESTYFLSANRNKLSIGVDLKHPKGKQIIKELADQSDVVIENFKFGTAAKLGVDYETLSKSNPRLIYASLTGYGEKGPQRDQPAYDAIVSAQGGLMSITGTPEGEPVRVGVAITDITTGLFCHGAILAALYARERSGKGQRIHVSLLAAQVAGLVNAGSAWLGAGHVGTPRGTAHESIVPYQAFPAADKWILVGALNDGQFAKLSRAVGEASWIEDDKFRSNADRVVHREELCAALSEKLKRRNASEWLEVFGKVGIPCSIVKSIPEVFEDPQVIANEMVQEVIHPSVGPLNLTSPPVGFSQTPSSIRLPPPLKGQHTRSLLQRIGYSATQISELEKEGICFQHVIGSDQ